MSRYGADRTSGQTPPTRPRAHVQARVDGTFGGCGFASDESPPSSNRFKGLRFQVTHVFMCFFPEVHTWELHTDTYPMRVERHLCDIMHVDGKTGVITLKVIEQQLATKGCFRPDMCSGVGDGGGENEGYAGVHSLLKADNPSYVNKRCMGHMPWTVAKAGMHAAGTLYDSTNALCVYLRDGVTWQRLKAIATTDRTLGGLQLFTEGSRRYNALLGTQPPNIIEDRPETAASFCRWLLPRQRQLLPLVTHDLAARNLELKQAAVGLATLTSLQDCANRYILHVMIEKSLYLYYYIKEKRYIAEHDDFQELMARASGILTSLKLDDKTMAILGVTPADVASVGLGANVTMNWVEFAINLNILPHHPHQTVDALIPGCIHLHEKMSIRMATHLSLTVRNIESTTWLAAKLLSRDPEKAKSGGRALRDHLARLRPGGMTPFERHVANDPTLMQELADFVDYPSPILLWHCNGKFANLFRFLAVRHLCVPDSVLDEEGIHAKWKWLELMKRSMKFKFLNASLKLQDYLHRFGGLPSGTDLNEHVKVVRETLALQYRAALADPDIAPEELRCMQLRERFGMRGVDVDILKQRVHRPAVPQTPAGVWSMYVRFLFEAHSFYRFTSLSNTRYLFIAENKSLPGREEVQPDEGVGRVLSIVWFRRADDEGSCADGIRVVPIAGDNGKLETMESTIAEISLAAGYYPPVGDSESAREVELKHERHLLSHDIVVYHARRCTYADGEEWGASWAWSLDENSTDIEEHAFLHRDLNTLTKMSLARQLQLRDNLTDNQRDRVWTLNKDTLLAAIMNPAAPVAAGVAAFAAPKAKVKAVAKPKAKVVPAKAAAKPKVAPKAHALPPAPARGRGARGGAVGGRGRGRGGRGGRG